MSRDDSCIITDLVDRITPYLQGRTPLLPQVEPLAAALTEAMDLSALVLLSYTPGRDQPRVAGWSQAGESAALALAQRARGAAEQVRRQGGALTPQQEADALVARLQGEGEALALPMVWGDHLAGLLVLLRPEPWRQAPIQAQVLSRILTAPLVQQRGREADALQDWLYNALVDQMRIGLYITDVKTDRILFMNRTMKQIFGLNHPEGQLCWQVLQSGMQQRCAFCPVQELLSRGEGAAGILWDEHNTVNGRVYENYDSLMRWIDGSLVHVQQSVDVTEKRALAQAANVDELTGVLTRRVGKERLEELTALAREHGQPLTVCMYDVNLLKQVNDTYGHREGDHILATIAQAAAQRLAGPELIFRLSGDEFVLALYGRTQPQARAWVEQMQRALAELSLEREKAYPYSFCYGLLEIDPGQTIPVDDILQRVDERMYAQKRLYRIRRNEEQMRLGATGGEAAGFTYDKEHLYDALVNSTDDYIYVCNMKTGVFRYPPAMVEEFDLPGEVIANAAAVWGERVHDHDKQAFLEANQEITDGRAVGHSVEYRARNRRGEWVWLRCRGRLEYDDQGEPSLFAGIITNLGRKNKIDHMTGLFNKFEFESVVTRRIAERPDKPMGLLVLGLDDFSRVNSLYDRAFGDEVLRIVSQRIQTLLMGRYEIYRLDGDEFAILYDGEDPQLADDIYARIQPHFLHQQTYNGHKYHCTLSAGCARYPLDADNYLDLLKYAAYALEHAKALGRNRLCHFNWETLQVKNRGLDLTERLRESVEHGFAGFSLAYQPQVDAATGALTGAEALCRFACEAYGPVSPAEFIPLLEDSGLIHAVGRWVFAQAAAQCARWADLAPGFSMSVNLSCRQLEEPDLLPLLQRTLEQTGVDPARMVLELTESYIAANMADLAETFRRIRALGMRIAMDDFGTGYSSLGILKQSPADIVKIDRTFVRDIPTSSFDATFIRFVVALCHDVGIQVCLEGVEQADELRAVADMRLDFVQGYLYGKPMAPEQFEAHARALAR